MCFNSSLRRCEYKLGKASCKIHKGTEGEISPCRKKKTRILFSTYLFFHALGLDKWHFRYFRCYFCLPSRQSNGPDLSLPRFSDPNCLSLVPPWVYMSTDDFRPLSLLTFSNRPSTSRVSACHLPTDDFFLVIKFAEKYIGILPEFRTLRSSGTSSRKFLYI